MNKTRKNQRRAGSDGASNGRGTNKERERSPLRRGAGGKKEPRERSENKSKQMDGQKQNLEGAEAVNEVPDNRNDLYKLIYEVSENIERAWNSTAPQSNTSDQGDVSTGGISEQSKQPVDERLQLLAPDERAFADDRKLKIWTFKDIREIHSQSKNARGGDAAVINQETVYQMEEATYENMPEAFVPLVKDVVREIIRLIETYGKEGFERLLMELNEMLKAFNKAHKDCEVKLLHLHDVLREDLITTDQVAQLPNTSDKTHEAGFLYVPESVKTPLNHVEDTIEFIMQTHNVHVVQNLLPLINKVLNVYGEAWNDYIKEIERLQKIYEGLPMNNPAKKKQLGKTSNEQVPYDPVDFEELIEQAWQKVDPSRHSTAPKSNTSDKNADDGATSPPDYVNRETESYENSKSVSNIAPNQNPEESNTSGKDLEEHESENKDLRTVRLRKRKESQKQKGSKRRIVSHTPQTTSPTTQDNTSNAVESSTNEESAMDMANESPTEEPAASKKTKSKGNVKPQTSEKSLSDKELLDILRAELAEAVEKNKLWQKYGLEKAKKTKAAKAELAEMKKKNSQLTKEVKALKKTQGDSNVTGKKRNKTTSDYNELLEINAANAMWAESEKERADSAEQELARVKDGGLQLIEKYNTLKKTHHKCQEELRLLTEAAQEQPTVPMDADERLICNKCGDLTNINTAAQEQSTAPMDADERLICNKCGDLTNINTAAQEQPTAPMDVDQRPICNECDNCNVLKNMNTELERKVKLLNTKNNAKNNTLKYLEKENSALTAKNIESERLIEALREQIDDLVRRDMEMIPNDHNKDVPWSERKNFTRLEMALALKRAERYKERYMELRGTIIWAELMREYEKKKDPDVERGVKKPSIWKYYKRIHPEHRRSQESANRKVPIERLDEIPISTLANIVSDYLDKEEQQPSKNRKSRVKGRQIPVGQGNSQSGVSRASTPVEKVKSGKRTVQRDKRKADHKNKSDDQGKTAAGESTGRVRPALTTGKRRKKEQQVAMDVCPSDKQKNILTLSAEEILNDANRTTLPVKIQSRSSDSDSSL